MGMPFLTRTAAMALCLAFCLALPRGAWPDSGPREPAQGDGLYFSLPLEDTMYVIASDQHNWTALLRSGPAIFFVRNDERTYLGDIDLSNPGGPDVVVLDANFDGRPEFMLKFDSSDTNQYYYLVDEHGAALGENLFGDPDMEFCNPTFQTTTRSITAWDRSGGLATYSLYKFRNGRYFLSEETEPIYEASCLMLERHIEYLGPDKTRSTVRYYGDMSGKAVKLRTVSKVSLRAKADAETPTNQHLNRGDLVIITDAAVGMSGHMLKVRRQQGRLEGWAPEEAFLVRTTKDAFLAAGPDSLEAAPGNLSKPYIPMDTELPVLTARKGRGGLAWLEVYFLEGDARGWIKESEVAPAPLPKEL